MYRSRESQTVARLGREHFERYDHAYEHFVGLCQSGVLAGALIHACKARCDGWPRHKFTQQS